MDFSKIKLIIWDLDDTIWKGTLSEDGADGIVLDERIINLFKRTTDCGVINSICSKNTKEDTIPVLEKFGLSGYIVFPSIDWTPKGARIKELIQTMNLRPVNVLFVDDNVQNLNEAKYYSAGLFTAEPSVIAELEAYFDELAPKDKEHKRLKQYRVLENKHEAASNYDSNEEFLYSSNIRVDVHKDCFSQFDRLYELSQRTNQLNFTKKREGIGDFRKSIESADDAGYVTVKDNFGDYGIVGFYVVKNNVLKHFLFSCRTIGQGIEQYVYASLGYPELTIIGEVYNKVSKEVAFPDWINQRGIKSQEIEKHELGFKVLFRGPCDLSSTAGYLDTQNIDCEFTYTSNKGNGIEVHLHHTGIQNLLLPQEKMDGLLQELPFIDEGVFDKKFWSGEYGLIVLSTLPEGGLGIYRRKSDGVKVAFNEYYIPLTDDSLWTKFINQDICTADNKFTLSFLKDFQCNWEFCGVTKADDYINFLDDFFAYPKNQNVHLALILGTEIPYLDNHHPNYIKREEYHKALNAAIRNYAVNKERLHLIEITPYITGQSCFTNNINHYTPEIYYKIAQDVIKIASNISGVEIQGRSKSWLYIDCLKTKMRRYMSPDSIVYKVLHTFYLKVKYGTSRA